MKPFFSFCLFLLSTASWGQQSPDIEVTPFQLTSQMEQFLSQENTGATSSSACTSSCESEKSVNSGLVEILLKRESTYEERQFIADTLSKSRENPALDTLSAVAELCYEADLCGSLTEKDDLDKECGNTTFGSEDGVPYQTHACFVRHFRNTYSCSKDVPKLSASGVVLMFKVLGDFQQTYNSLLYPNLVEFYAREAKIDVADLINNHDILEEYFKQNPEAEKKMEKIIESSAALGQYTLDCYSRINPILFSKDEKKLARYYNLINATINTMKLLPPYKGKVNRGVNLPESVLKEHHKVGNVVCYEGFTSTAVHDAETDMGDKPRNGFLDNECGQRLYINYEENGASPGRRIDTASASRGENEVLFEPGACFRIDKVYPRTDVSKIEEGYEPQKCSEGSRYNFEMTLVPSPKG